MSTKGTRVWLGRSSLRHKSSSIYSSRSGAAQYCTQQKKIMKSTFQGLNSYDISLYENSSGVHEFIWLIINGLHTHDIESLMKKIRVISMRYREFTRLIKKESRPGDIASPLDWLQNSLGPASRRVDELIIHSLHIYWVTITRKTTNSLGPNFASQLCKLVTMKLGYFS